MSAALASWILIDSCKKHLFYLSGFAHVKWNKINGNIYFISHLFYFIADVWTVLHLLIFLLALRCGWLYTFCAASWQVHRCVSVPEFVKNWRKAGCSSETKCWSLSKQILTTSMLCCNIQLSVTLVVHIHCEPKKRGSIFAIINLEKHARFK